MVLEGAEFVLGGWLGVRIVLLVQAELVVAGTEAGQAAVQLGDPLATCLLWQGGGLEGVEVASESGVGVLDVCLDAFDLGLAVGTLVVALGERVGDRIAHEIGAV